MTRKVFGCVWRRGRALVFVAVLAWAAVTAVIAAGHSRASQVPQPAPQEPTPEPPAAFVRLCVKCHPASRVVDARRARSQWEEVLDQMVTRGATGSDEDFEIVLEFLVTEYGRVAINSAPADELAQVLHLDAKAADAIVGYRKTHGPFADFDALVAMPGAPVEALRKRRDAIVF
jgi:competence protein ComEA